MDIYSISDLTLKNQNPMQLQCKHFNLQYFILFMSKK